MDWILTVKWIILRELCDTQNYLSTVYKATVESMTQTHINSVFVIALMPEVGDKSPKLQL